MYLEIKDDILNINQIKRINKEIEDVYEQTEEYKKYLSDNKNMFSIFIGTRYTDKIVEYIYKIIVFTEDFDVMEYTYDTDEDRLKDYEKICIALKLRGEIND